MQSAIRVALRRGNMGSATFARHTCRRFAQRLRPLVLVGALAFVCQPKAVAVLLLGTGDPAANTNAPTGDLAGSGWQYQGRFGDFMGTAIAPSFFITAKHIGWAGPVFTFHGVDYDVVERFDDRWTDLTIWRVSGILPTFAPLYPREDEAGQHLVVIGRGSERGSDVLKEGVLRGWTWGAQTHLQRWGENAVSRIAYAGTEKQFLYAAFDAAGGPNEAHLSAGDSGGAVFLNDGGTWKLAGINSAVDGPFYAAETRESRFDGALTDVNGFYASNDGGRSFYPYASAAPRPSGFFAARISSRRQWIYSVVDPAGDLDRDGISNLLEYAFDLAPEQPDAGGLPQFSIENGAPTLIYRQMTTARELRYTVEKSTDLRTWEPANAEEESIDWVDYLETFKVTLPAASSGRVSLRVVVTKQ